MVGILFFPQIKNGKHSIALTLGERSYLKIRTKKKVVKLSFMSLVTKAEKRNSIRTLPPIHHWLTNLIGCVVKSVIEKFCS